MKEKPNLIITPDKYTGIYSNASFVSFSATEFLVDFAVNLPGTPPIVANRIVVNPSHAKLLAKALTNAVEEYEKENGEIVLPVEGGDPDDVRMSESAIKSGNGKKNHAC